MKLLLDEMLSPRIAEHLRDRGFDVIAVAESTALRRQPDERIFEHACADGRVVATKNISDFRPLAANAVHSGQGHPGLILINNRRFPDHDPRSVGRIIAALELLLSGDPNLTNTEY